MNFEEYRGKAQLRSFGITTLDSELVTTADAAATAAERLGAVVVKAQVPTGKRGKAGGIALANTPAEARAAAERILSMSIGIYPVERLLIEQQASITQEYYAAVLNDPSHKGATVMFSAEGGMDIEALAAQDQGPVRRLALPIDTALDQSNAETLVSDIEEARTRREIATTLVKLHALWRGTDAELVEINPLALLADGRIIALDCKLVVDDSAAPRQTTLAEQATPDPLTALEQRALALDLKFIELDGDIGVLANGAGLTMTTMDVIAHHGGTPANFLEIGGEAYTKATDALALVLDNPRVKSLVVNFCGAFARTDVMTEGVINGLQQLKPTTPVFFAIHGTGAAEARAMLSERLDTQAYPTMDDAIRAAIDSAGGRA